MTGPANYIRLATGFTPSRSQEPLRSSAWQRRSPTTTRVNGLMTQLANGRPVMVWTTSNMTIRPVATWTAADGVTVKGVPGEHTYLAVGYDADGALADRPVGWPATPF